MIASAACALLAGTAWAAAPSAGRHFPHFSLLGERVAVKRLPLQVRFLIDGGPRPPRRGQKPVWFGEVERGPATIYGVARGHTVCTFEEPNGMLGGGNGSCTTAAAARELYLLDVGSCGRGKPRRFQVSALVPDGVSGLEIEKSDGDVGRTVPAVENTVAFKVGREDITLRGTGDAAAESLERHLPLAGAAHLGDTGPGCSFYTFAEGK